VVDDKRKNYFIHSIFSIHIAMSIPKDIFSRMHSGDSLPHMYPKKEGAATARGRKIKSRAFYRCTNT